MSAHEPANATSWLRSSTPVGGTAEEAQPILKRPHAVDGYSLMRGLFAPYVDVGPTPIDWRSAEKRPTRKLDRAILRAASTVGRVMGWANQQDGRLVHDIVPSPGFEHAQVGASSADALVWHTEDAFHPDRADLIMLVCVRDPDEVGTDVASVRRAGLSEGDKALLRRPLVHISPDDSYGDSWDTGDRHGMATVWDGEDGLCLRYDPSYSRLPEDDQDFRHAYASLESSLPACADTAVRRPGDAVIIDNDVAVHSRRPFRARYDGTDRWLKRVLIRSGERTRPRGEAAEHGFGQTPLLTGPETAVRE